MELIKVIKNFIPSEQRAVLIDYINSLEESMPDEFTYYHARKRLALQFGRDLYNKESSRWDLTLLGDREPEIRELFAKAIQATKDSFEVDQAAELYACCLWIAKQYPGAVIGEHEDTDDGFNMHFEYSAVIYLNTLEDSGYLEFPDLNYTCRPEAGDLVIFPSKSTGLHRVLEIREDRYSMPLWLTTDRSFEL